MEVIGKAFKLGDIDIREGAHFSVQAVFERSNAGECFLPSLLQLGRNEAVIWVAGRIAPFGQFGVVARLAKFHL